MNNKVYDVQNGQSNKQSQFDDNDNNIVFEDLDIIDWNIKPYFLFLIWYIFNTLFVLPCFILKTIIEFFRTLSEAIEKNEIIQIFLIIFYYVVDVFVAISVLMMYPLAFLDYKQAPIDFQYWSISNLIFWQSFILTQSYMLTIVKDRQTFEFADLVSDENMRTLGLGRMIVRLTFTESGLIQKQQTMREEMDVSIERAQDEENIDPTLFYFAIDQDQGIVTAYELQDLSSGKIQEFKRRAQERLEQPIIQYCDARVIDKHNQILKLIRPQGFRGQRHIIENLLWPHYQYIKQMEHMSDIQISLIILAIILLKISFPLYEIYNSPKEDNMWYSLLILFAGMQLNMISILIGLLINDDLKGKRYILTMLQTLIDMSNDGDDESGRLGSEVSVEGQETTSQNFYYKLDLSCNLSLESWDNVRRLTIMLEREKINLYETTFSFLAFYLIYTYIILSEDFLGFNIFPSLHNFFKSPIQEWNMMMDLLLITILFLLRVNQGSLYNKTFDVIIGEKIYIILYQSSSNNLSLRLLRSMKKRRLYFSSTSINPIYKKITHKIYSTAAEKVIFSLMKNNETVTPQKFRELVSEQAKDRIHQLCFTMKKIIMQINSDDDNYCHKFLGWFRSNTTKVFSSFFVLFYIFFHRKFKSYLMNNLKH